MTEENHKKKPIQVGRHRDLNPGPPECESRYHEATLLGVFSFVSAFSQKKQNIVLAVVLAVALSPQEHTRFI